MSSFTKNRAVVIGCGVKTGERRHNSLFYGATVVNISKQGAGAVVAEALEYKKTSPFQNTAVATGLG